LAAAPELIHATCIEINGRGVLIRGPSGSGKSDLALRCLAAGVSALLPNAATLVADDQVLLDVSGERLTAQTPPALRGRMEVRGQGIISLQTTDWAEIVLIADLLGLDAAIDRLPDPVMTARLFGHCLPVLRLHPFEASAPVKLLTALATQYGHAGG
jgi:HPr kinase/phosphorylase